LNIVDGLDSIVGSEYGMRIPRDLIDLVGLRSAKQFSGYLG